MKDYRGLEIPYLSSSPFGVTSYPGDAGIDLPIVGEHVLGPGESKDLPSGIRMAIPDGFYGRITGRSSALRKKLIKVHEGIIDSGFRGELFSYVTNESTVATVLTPADRVAQLIVQPVVMTTFVWAEVLSESERGTRGFGSSDAEERQAAKMHLNAMFGKTVVVPHDGEQAGYPAMVSPLVYLAGPIDHAPSNGWRVLAWRLLGAAGYRVFDPWQEAKDMLDPLAIYNQNMDAIDRSDAMVVNLKADEPGHYGFGTPIEIFVAAAQDKPVIVLHDPDRVGVYLRALWQKGVVVVPNWDDAIKELQESLSSR